MSNLKEKLARFMSGRNGVDQLYYALLTAVLILMVADTFIRSSIVNMIISTITWVILIWMLFRVFSRDIAQRRRENEKFMKIWKPAKANASLTGRRIKESRTHRFRQCPHCQAVLRLPRKTGKHTVKCPRCHKDFEVHITM